MTGLHDDDVSARVEKAIMLLLGLALLVAGNTTGSAPCPGTTTPEVNACLAGRFQHADAELNRYYQAALQRLRTDGDEKTMAKLVQAQRSWIGYRDAECGAVFENWSGGTIRVSMEWECETRLTRLRTFVIWRHWLTYVDSTPPTLPRPALDDATSSR